MQTKFIFDVKIFLFLIVGIILKFSKRKDSVEITELLLSVPLERI